VGQGNDKDSPQHGATITENALVGLQTHLDVGIGRATLDLKRREKEK
jgi:hypothetical protein